MKTTGSLVLCSCLAIAAALAAGPAQSKGAGAPAAPAKAAAPAKPAMDARGAETIPNNGKPMSASTAAAFDRLKELVGDWEGKTAEGRPVQVSYRLISAGTCVEESMTQGGQANMVSIYCPDGDGVLMTHYCAANNQPRMRAARLSGDRNVLSFAFVDVSNLPDDAAGHMHHLEMTFQDARHFSQAWTYRQNGQDGTDVFTFSRKNA